MIKHREVVKLLKNKKALLTIALAVVAVALFIYCTHEKPVDFNTEVKPIINKKCITCHGGVKRQGDFSLLFRSEAVGKTKSGKYGIIPGDPEGSEMIRRLTLKDPEERMPYKHEPLSEAEIATLRKWVKQGAKWGDHWAYVAVKPVTVPNNDWGHNNIDHFIYQQLEEHELQPSPEADKATLLRRLSLDLTGIPAPSNIATAFLSGP